MKSTKIFYWIFTVLFAALMLFSSIPDILNTADAIAFMNGQLQYPLYIIPFIGWGKVIGVIVILLPLSGNFIARMKEWAYAGLFIDLAGATYSVLAVGGFNPGILFMFLFIAMGIGSYIFYHKKLAHV